MFKKYGLFGILMSNITHLGVLMESTTYIWKNGTFVNWNDATTHVLSHGLHYASAVFEGIRAYKTSNGTAIFRSDEHYQRLLDSGKMYLMDIPYSVEELTAATKELIKKNDIDSCYIRPIAYRGYGEMGLNPLPNPIDVVIAVWPWGTYLGEDGLKNGIKCKISSWARVDSRIMPPLSKCVANYANSSLAKMEALNCGYDEAIMLNTQGTIAEGPGENLFLVKNGKLFTTSTADSALQGITSQTIISLAESLNIPVTHCSLIRDQLFTADELFFTGTAAEVTPIRDVDGRQIGSGTRGPITKQLQEAYFDVVKGKNEAYSHFLTYI